MQYTKEELNAMNLDELRETMRNVAEMREAHPNSTSKKMLALDDLYMELDDMIQEREAKITLRKDMVEIMDGDRFYINGEEHIADGDAHYSGDATYDGYIVYDTDGESWFEDDFPESA